MAAQRLEVLLENNPIARRKVSTLLSRYTNQLLSVMTCKNPKTVMMSLALIKDNALKQLKVKENISEDIRSHTSNIIVYRYRVFMGEYKNMIPLILENQKKKERLDFQQN